MKKFSWKKLLSLVLVAALVVGTFRVGGKVSADENGGNSLTDSITIFARDMEEDSTKNKGFLFVQNANNGVDANKYQEKAIRSGLMRYTTDRLLLDNGLTTTAKNGSTNDIFGMPFEPYTLEMTPDANGFYSFDSNKQTMVFGNDNGNRVAYVYDGARSTEAKFLPFNNQTIGWNESANLYFAIQFQRNFSLPQYGTIDGTKDGEAVVFEFTGDDDVWVVIDNQIILDIGGIHKAIKGVINFKDSTVKYYDHNDKSIGNGSFDRFYDEANSTNHTLKFYYLERGGGESNCTFRYNLPKVNLQVKHVFRTAEGEWELEESDTPSDKARGKCAPKSLMVNKGDKVTKELLADYLIPEGMDKNVYANTVDLKVNDSEYESADEAGDGATVYVFHDRNVKYGVRYFEKGNDTPIKTYTNETLYRYGSTVTLDAALKSLNDTSDNPLTMDTHKPQGDFWNEGYCKDDSLTLTNANECTYFDIYYTKQETVEVKFFLKNGENDTNPIQIGDTYTIMKGSNFDTREIPSDGVVIAAAENNGHKNDSTYKYNVVSYSISGWDKSGDVFNAVNDHLNVYNVVTDTITRYFDVVVKYLEEGTNNTLAEAVTDDKNNSLYSITETPSYEAKPIAGYKADADTKSASFSPDMSGHTAEVIFYYSPIEYNYQINYGYMNGDTFVKFDDNVAKSASGTITIKDDAKSVISPYIDGYKLSDVNQNEVTVALNKKDPKSIIINVPYIDNDAHSLTIKYGYMDGDKFVEFTDVKPTLDSTTRNNGQIDGYGLNKVNDSYTFNTLEVVSGDVKICGSDDKELDKSAYTKDAIYYFYYTRSDANAVVHVIYDPVIYTVKFFVADGDNQSKDPVQIGETRNVLKGKDATEPSSADVEAVVPENRDEDLKHYTYTLAPNWDKPFTDVQSNLEVYKYYPIFDSCGKT